MQDPNAPDVPPEGMTPPEVESLYPRVLPEPVAEIVPEIVPEIVAPEIAASESAHIRSPDVIRLDRLIEEIEAFMLCDDDLINRTIEHLRVFLSQHDRERLLVRLVQIAHSLR